MLARQERAASRSTGAREYDEAWTRSGSSNHDVYLIDYRLGEHTGLELVREGFAARPYAPVIMLTGEATYEMDLEATALGVTDYLVKQKLDPQILERSIRYAISHQQAIRDLSLSARSATRWPCAPPTTGSGIGTWRPAGSTSRRAGTRSSAGRGETPPTMIPASGLTSCTPATCCACAAAIEAHLDGRTPASAVRAPHAPCRRHVAVGDDPRARDPGRRRPADPDGRLAVGRHRSPDRAAAPAARRAARHPHRPAQPHAVHGSRQPDPATGRSATRRPAARSCSWTSTGSSSSTTASATPSATTC